MCIENDLHLSEEPLAAATSRAREVDVDVVVLGRDRFLHEWFMEGYPVDFDMIFVF